MPIDYENMRQFRTPLACPECGEHTFQTDAEPQVLHAFIDAECTNCGHALTKTDIEGQASVITPSDIQAMMATYRGT